MSRRGVHLPGEGGEKMKDDTRAQQWFAILRTRTARRIAAALTLALGVMAVPLLAQAALDPVNLALGKDARQSSQYDVFDSSRVVDGNTNGAWWNYSINHTWNDPHSWWEVDLGEVRQIGRIEIYNRTDCCMER